VIGARWRAAWTRWERLPSPPFNRTRLWYGRGWAVQVDTSYPQVSFGLSLDLRRPMLDLHLGCITVALGVCAHMTNARDRERMGARGFMFTDTPYL
jgi:hypothetical protein